MLNKIKENNFLPRINTYKEIMAVILVFSVALAIRIYHLGFHDFWYDEIGSIYATSNPWDNWSAPLYWILLHFWIKIFGISEFSLRLPSVIFSFLTVILVYALGKNLFGRRAGILAGIIAGLSPFHLWYAQEARDYGMLLFFGTLSTYVFYAAIKKNSLTLWAYFVLVSLIGIYTDYFYMFLIIAQGICLLFFKKTSLSLKEIIPFCVIILGFSLYLPKFLDKFYFVWQGFWIPNPTLASIGITVENFLLGYNAFPGFYIIADVMAALFSAAALTALFNQELRKPLLLCLFLFVMPVVCAFLFSKLFFPVYLDRGLIIATPYLYLILSLGAVSLPKTIKWTLFSGLIFVMLVSAHNFFEDLMPAPLYHHYGIHIKKPVKPLVKFLKENAKPQDIIAFTDKSVMPSVKFYLNTETNPLYFFFAPFSIDNTWHRPVAESSYNVPLYKINSLDIKRVWIIASTWERSGALNFNSRIVRNWLDERLKLEFSKEFDGLRLFRYTK